MTSFRNVHNSLSSQCFSFLEEESFTDVILIADGRFLNCHKVVLAASSSYFKEILSLLTDKKPAIVLKDVSYRHLQQIMTYIYCGTVDIAENEVEIFRNILDSLKINYDVEDEGDADFDHTGTTEHEEESSLSLQESSDFPSFSIKEEPKDEFSIEYTEHHESVMDIEDSKSQNDKTDFLNLLNFPEKTQPVPKVLRFQPSIDGKISMGRVVPNRKLQQFMTENAMLCPFCRKLFKTTKHRNEHVKYCFDNPNRIVSNCPICKKSVCDPYYLRKHLRNVHGQASDTPTATSSS